MKILLYTWFLLILSNFTVASQVKLDRDKCREMALEYSRQLQLSQNQKEQALLDRKIAKAGYLPKFSASGTYLYEPDALEYSLEGGYLPTYIPDDQGNMQPNIMQNPVTGQPVTGPDGNPVFNMYALMPDININVGLEGVTMAGVEVQQPVYMGGKIRAANKLAKAGVDIANLQVEQTVAEVLLKTDEAFYQLIAVKSKKTAAKQYKTLLDSLVSNIKAGMEEGMATRNDLLKVQVKRNDAILMVQKAQSAEKLAAMNLCRIIGLPLQSDISVSTPQKDSLLSVKLTETENNISRRPEYQMLSKVIDIKEYEAEMARAEMLPEVGISAGYHYFGGLELNGRGTDEMSFMALASVKIPVFKWFEERNKLTKAKLQSRAAGLDLEETEKLLQLEIAQAKFNLEDAVKRYELTLTALEQAKENLETSRQQYEEGLETLVNLLEAQAQWQEAQSEHIDARTSVKLAETKYLKAIGELK
jgi:outer membrane protein TolC